MAGAFKALVRSSRFYAVKNYAVTVNSAFTAYQPQTKRNLYSREALGLDAFDQQRDRVKQQTVNIADKFRDKMREYTKEDSKNMVFTEDLKNMIHLVENDEDFELAVKMMKKFNQQNKGMRFGSYIFGTVVMRLMHKFNKADLALELFNAPELTGFFDQLMTYQILFDLLYENQRYQDMLDTFPIIKERQIEGTKYPKNLVALILAACYKLNSKESWDYALNLWKELQDARHIPMRRAFTFCAGLALNQGKPEAALEMLSTVKNTNYTTVRNIKVAALVDIGRIEDALEVLKSVIRNDEPETKIHTFNTDIIEKVKKAVESIDNPDIKLEFNRLYELFKKQGHISHLTLDQQLCSELQTPTKTDRRPGFVPRNQYPQMIRNRNRNFVYNAQRPGLQDLV